MTTVRVYRVLVYEGDAASVQKAMDRRTVKDVQLSTGYCIREVNCGNIILDDQPVMDRMQLKLLEFAKLERQQANSYFPDDDSKREGYCDALDFIINTWKK